MNHTVNDDDRKAHQFSDNVLANPGDFGPDSVATARAVKAHVPAPPKSLADELRDTPRWWTDGAPTWEQCCARFEALADRAEAIEKARDKAQQDAVDAWEHAAQTDRDHVRAMGLWEQDYTRVATERDAHVRDYRVARNQRDEARAEVEQLAEALDRRGREVAAVTVDRDRLAVQKGAESNAESLDPADVPPG